MAEVLAVIRDDGPVIRGPLREPLYAAITCAVYRLGDEGCIVLLKDRAIALPDIQGEGHRVPVLIGEFPGEHGVGDIQHGTVLGRRKVRRRKIIGMHHLDAECVIYRGSAVGRGQEYRIFSCRGRFPGHNPGEFVYGDARAGNGGHRVCQHVACVYVACVHVELQRLEILESGILGNVRPLRGIVDVLDR